jgi:uncharacterized OsmC-like protein
MTEHTPRKSIVVTHDAEKRFTVAIRDHRIVVDQPVHAGGGDAGPGPLELLGASLGACVAFYVQQFCHARLLPFAGLRVEVEQSSAPNPARIARFHVRVTLPGSVPAAYLPMLERVVRSCPAHNTLTSGADVSVELLAEASVARS